MYEQSMTKRVKLILFRMDVIPATRPSWSSDLYMVKLDRIHVVAVLMQPCCTWVPLLLPGCCVAFPPVARLSACSFSSIECMMISLYM